MFLHLEWLNKYFNDYVCRSNLIAWYLYGYIYTLVKLELFKRSSPFNKAKI